MTQLDSILSENFWVFWLFLTMLMSVIALLISQHIDKRLRNRRRTGEALERYTRMMVRGYAPEHWGEKR